MTIDTTIDFASLVERTLPDIYVEQGPVLVAFLRAYYQWMTDHEAGSARHLLGWRDIDETVDEFLLHFKNKFLHDIPLTSTSDLRRLVKFNNDIYDSRGTPEAIVLLFRMLYGADAAVYRPGDDILKASDGKWRKPVYLEVTPTTKGLTMAGSQVTGSYSGATAFVETIARRTIVGRVFDVLYLSHISGDFQTGENVTVDGILAGTPIIVGSLNDIDVLDGGRNNAIGDVFDVVSDDGKQGRARVAAVVNGTGRVDFDLIDGGYGYSANAQTAVAAKMLAVSNVSAQPRRYETVWQDMANLTFTTANNTFAVGDTIKGYTSGTWIEHAVGTVLAVTQNGAAGTMRVQVPVTQWFGFADTLRKAGNTIAATLTVTADATATGNVVGSNSTYIGVTSVGNTFMAPNGSIATIRGLSSGITANVDSVGTGSGAAFRVGTLSGTESVYVASDFIGGNNSGNIAYLNVRLTGESSGVGRVSSIVVGQEFAITGLVGTFANGDYVTQNTGATVTATGNVYFANSTVLRVWPESGTFTATPIYANTANATVSTITVLSGSGYTNSSVVTLTGGSQSVNNVTISVGGTGYKNGEYIVFTANAGTGAQAVVSTNSTGGITGTVLRTGGYQYTTTPTLTVNTAAGTGATLVAVMSAANAATATVNTNGTGNVNVVTVTAAGTQYSTRPTVAIATGTGANVYAVMDFGLGFPKAPYYDLGNIINSMLDYDTVTIGTIASLAGLSPGSGYNLDPFVAVVEPLIAGYDRKDMILAYTTANGAFLEGERLTQAWSASATTLTFTGIAGNTAFDVGELITQAASSANGIVNYRDATTLILESVQGTFINTSNSTTTLAGAVSLATANVSNVVSSTLTATTKGLVRSVNTAANTMVVRRTTFNTSFNTTGRIRGATSLANATVATVMADVSSLSMGNNANVDSTVTTANGIATTVEIIDSGFGYRSDELVTLSNSDNVYNITGYATTNRQGTSEGYWESTHSFLSSDKYLHDGEYYQSYSYEIQSPLSIEHYGDMVKNVLHVAGTKLFGRIDINNTIDMTVEVADSSVTGEDQ